MTQKFVDIIALDNDQETLAARAMLEWWGAVTRTYFIGKSQDLVDILGGQEKLAPNILIMCHGVDEGIVLPDLDEKIAKQQPYDKFLTPTNLVEFLKLNGQTIVNTGCKTGTQEFADAFLNAGAKSYIAPKDFPEGNASLFYVLNLYYFLFAKKLSVTAAHEKSKTADFDTDIFKLFER